MSMLSTSSVSSESRGALTNERIDTASHWCMIHMILKTVDSNGDDNLKGKDVDSRFPGRPHVTSMSQIDRFCIQDSGFV